jgi:ankyrin repeat protein
MIYGYKNPITYEMIEDVLQHKPNVDAQDCNKADAMIYACMTSSPELVELLIKYDVNVNYALMVGICNNNIEHVKMLCCKNADINFNLMLAQAKKLKFNDIYKFLLQKRKG